MRIGIGGSRLQRFVPRILGLLLHSIALIKGGGRTVEEVREGTT